MDAAEVPASDLASRPVSLAPGQAEQWVLVADDSVDNRLVSRRLLEQAGFRVLEAADGQQAVDLWATRHPSLILMDLRMPVMDGVGAGKRIRDAERGMRDADGRGRHVPIVAVTAHAAIDDGPSGLFSIFDDVLRKPIEAADLFEKIGKHLGVVFVERRLGQPAARAGQMRTSDIRPADLAALPLDWLAAFSQALRRGRSAEMLKLTAQLGVEHADLAQSLAALVRVHAYDRLLVATGVALEEASHG
jgi:CheY-like chemotaxis protein